MPEQDKTGWALLHSKLPSAAIRALSKDVYGVEGLSDVNEAYLIQRLFASGLPWEWHLGDPNYLGFEDRAVRGKDYTARYYLVSIKGELIIDGRSFHGAGASDNRKLDAASKGAATVAFKNAAKIAGLTIELFKDGRAMDFIYEDRQGNVVDAGASQRPTGEVDGSTGASPVVVNQPASPTPPVGAVGERSESPQLAASRAPAMTSPPPQTSEGRLARSVGPRAKRQNVVTVEQDPEKATTAPEAPLTVNIPTGPVPSLTDEPESIDEGLRVYREQLRQGLREQTATLYRVNVLLENVKRALEGKEPMPVPDAVPSEASDKALAARIETDWPGETLATLDEIKLGALTDRFEANLKRKREVLKERGIKE